MGKQKTNMHPEIQRLVLQKIASAYQSISKASHLGGLENKVLAALNEFLKKNKDSNGRLARYPGEFDENRRKTIVDRALNEVLQKHDQAGAKKDILDLYSYFITDCKHDYFELLKKVDPKRYKEYLPSVHKDYHPPVSIKKENYSEIEYKQIERQRNKILREEITKKDEHIGEKDPTQPVFPPKEYFTPRWPATHSFSFKYNDFTIWIKDESENPTGTHKARMAYEIVNRFDEDFKTYGHPPVYSLITAGNAAFAIQSFFNLYDKETNLYAVMHETTSDEIENKLNSIGCKVVRVNLKTKPLSSNDIRDIVKREYKVVVDKDLTAREISDLDFTEYYDWLSYEILSDNPDYCYIPFGTGDLFINVLRILEKEHERSLSAQHDLRFHHANLNTLKACNFIGATSFNEHDGLDKIYSYHLPHKKDYKNMVRDMKSKNLIGYHSDILGVEKYCIQQAMEIMVGFNRSRNGSHKPIKYEASSLAGLALFLQTYKKYKIPSNKKILIINTGKPDYSFDPQKIKSQKSNH